MSKNMLEMFNKTNIRNVGAIITILLCFVALFIVCFHPVPPDNQRLVDMAFGGILTVGFSSVYAWLFGSSKIESDKAKKDLEN